MRLSIGIITSVPQLKIIQEALPEIEIHCAISVYVARHNEQAYELYEANRRKHDAFVFSGRAFMFSVAKRISGPRRPCYYFDDMTGNINNLILRLVLQDRSFDFSRTFVDIACKGNDYLNLKKLLPPEQWPYFADESREPLTINLLEGDADEITQRTLERHLALHREKKIDLSISRFGTIVSQLDNMGIPTVYLETAREYVVNFLMQVINSFSKAWARDQMMGCAALEFTPDHTVRNETIASISKTVMKYAGRHSLDFSLLRERNTLQILTRRADLAKLTKDFTDSGDIQSLTPDGSILWGLGTGISMFQAKRNAANAINVAKRAKGGVYYISEAGEVTGPIGSNSSIYEVEPPEGLLRFSSAFHIDHVNLQKILAYTKLINSTAVTAEGLADFLGVTTRSARRLLQKILIGGGINVYEETAGGRGRPKKCYNLLFLNDVNLDDS